MQRECYHIRSPYSTLSTHMQSSLICINLHFSVIRIVCNHTTIYHIFCVRIISVVPSRPRESTSRYIIAEYLPLLSACASLDSIIAGGPLLFVYCCWCCCGGCIAVWWPCCTSKRSPLLVNVQSNVMSVGSARTRQGTWTVSSSEAPSKVTSVGEQTGASAGQNMCYMYVYNFMLARTGLTHTQKRSHNAWQMYIYFAEIRSQPLKHLWYTLKAAKFAAPHRQPRPNSLIYFSNCSPWVRNETKLYNTTLHRKCRKFASHSDRNVYPPNLSYDCFWLMHTNAQSYVYYSTAKTPTTLPLSTRNPHQSMARIQSIRTAPRCAYYSIVYFYAHRKPHAYAKRTRTFHFVNRTLNALRRTGNHLIHA